MNINGLQVEQDDLQEVRTFQHTLYTTIQQQYPQHIQQHIQHVIHTIDPTSHATMTVSVQYVQNLPLLDRRLVLRGFIDFGYPMIVKLLLSHGLVLGGGAKTTIWLMIDVAAIREKGSLVKYLFAGYNHVISYDSLFDRRRLFSIMLYAFGREPFDNVVRTELVKQLWRLHEDIGGDLPLYRNAFLAVLSERNPQAYQRIVQTYNRLKLRLTTMVQRKYKRKHQKRVNAVRVIQTKVQNLLYRPGRQASYRGTVPTHGYRVPVRERFVPRGTIFDRLQQIFNILKTSPKNMDTVNIRQLNRTIRNTSRETRPRLRNILQERRNTLSRERTVRKLTSNIMKKVVKDIERESAAYSRRIRPPTGDMIKSLARRFNR